MGCMAHGIIGSLIVGTTLVVQIEMRVLSMDLNTLYLSYLDPPREPHISD